MSKKSGWGGARPHPPGREGGRPRVNREVPKNVTYRRPAIEPPVTLEEEAALEAFNELKPPERLEVIVQWHKLTKPGEPSQGQG